MFICLLTYFYLFIYLFIIIIIHYCLSLPKNKLEIISHMQHLTHPLSPQLRPREHQFSPSPLFLYFQPRRHLRHQAIQYRLRTGKIEVCLVRLLDSPDQHGGGISVGVARADISERGELLHQSHGWSLNLAGFLTYSGAPQYFRGKEYGPRKEDGRYVRDGDVIGLVMDMVKGGTLLYCKRRKSRGRLQRYPHRRASRSLCYLSGRL